MVWADSQDCGADEILYIARIVLFDKINRLMREITILFGVSPQLFQGLSPVVRTLKKYGIKISYVAGVSSGSVIGAALAAGKLDEFEDFFRRINWWKMFRMFFEFSWP